MFRLALASLSVAAAQPATLQPCGGSITWSSLVITPTNPQAGDTVTLNATGVASSSITSSPASEGIISAYLFGLEAFAAPVNTCGAGQQVDVMGITTGDFDALSCPIAAHSKATLGFSIAIPSVRRSRARARALVTHRSARKRALTRPPHHPQVAQGLGQLQIFVNATDQNSAVAYCLNMSVTL